MIKAEKRSEAFCMLLFGILYLAYPIGMHQYIKHFIPDFTSLETNILIALGIFSGFHLLLATRDPIKALWPIIITASILFLHYVTINYQLCVIQVRPKATPSTHIVAHGS
ncbi:TPA: hypothetical protein KKX01_002731 [Legionella pneumophila]|nr:hypothetical protein [Legionella pneumophila]